MTKSRFLKAVDRTVKGRGGKGIQELEALQIPLELIDPDLKQPRQNIDAESASLLGLRESIQEFGVLEPILVLKGPKAGRYKIISGHRRYFASVAEGKSHIPARVFAKKWDINQIRLIQLSENIQREDLSPLEISRCLVSLAKQKSMTQAKLGKKLGLSQPAVSAYLSLQKLSGKDLEFVESQSEPLSLRQMLELVRGSKTIEDFEEKNDEKSEAVRAKYPRRPKIALHSADQSFTLRRNRSSKNDKVLLEFPQSMSSKQLLEALLRLTKSLSDKDFKELDEKLELENDKEGKA